MELGTAMKKWGKHHCFYLLLDDISICTCNNKTNLCIGIYRGSTIFSRNPIFYANAIPNLPFTASSFTASPTPSTWLDFINQGAFFIHLSTEYLPFQHVACAHGRSYKRSVINRTTISLAP